MEGRIFEVAAVGKSEAVGNYKEAEETMRKQKKLLILQLWTTVRKLKKLQLSKSLSLWETSRKRKKLLMCSCGLL